MRRVKVCGPKGCATVNAIIDTGANIVNMTEPLAQRLGIGDKNARGAVRGIGGAVEAYAGVARICLLDRGCGCLTGQVAVLATKDFGNAEVLVGQDYLEASRAIIDTVGRTLRCRMRRR